MAAVLALPALAQVSDLSERSGRFGDRFDSAVQRISGGGEGTGFYIVFRCEGLVPSDVEAGGGGSMMINRYDGWIVSGMSGLAPSQNVWNRLESGERLLDLATMQMTDPDPEPVLVSRQILAVVRGKVLPEEGIDLDDISLRMPAGKIRLRDRSVLWIGDAGRSELEVWIGSRMASLDATDDRTVRRDLVGLLSLLPRGGEVLNQLEELATDDPDRSIRRAAITYLGRRPEDTAGTLTSILAGTENPEERSVALEALADRIGPDASNRLIEAARDEDEAEEVRRVAISYLARIDGATVDRALEGLFSSPDPEIRKRVAEAWERRAPDRAIPLLERVCTTDEDEEVCRQAVASLGDIDVPAAGDALESVFNSTAAESVRRRALRELSEKRNGDPAMVNWLAGIARNDSSLEIRKEAVRQLGRTNTPQARRALEDVRLRAVR
jgi:HEAT repeat protein